MDDIERDPIDLVAEEFADQYRRGERPTVREFVAKYPQWADQLLAVLPPVAKLEELKGLRRTPATPTAHVGSASAPSQRGTRLEVPKLERLGDFRIVRQVGGGGMGIVYEAVQESLGRRVAVKVLPKNAVAEKRKLARFRREAQAASRLHHTNIVPVYGVGEHDGLHYYAMQFINGHGLNEIIAQWRHEQSDSGSDSAHERRDLDHWRRIAAIGVQAAEALSYAHRQGTLHRDIKPSNLLLDERGVVWIADFGLAKWLEKPGLTDVGELVGTLQYLAPECLHAPADPRADVYSLGLTLYELLTLKAAFDGWHPAKLIKQLGDHEPSRPRACNPAIPPDLETIVLKAIARDPAQRYQTAAELAGDLQRFLDDRPLSARRASAVERFWRWSRRNRVVAALAALLIVVFLSGFVGVLCMWREAVAEYARAEEHLRTAQEALRREATERDKAQAATARAEANVQLSLQALEEIFEAMAPEEVGTRRGGLPAGAAAASFASEEEAALLQGVLNFYEQFAQQNDTDPRLQNEAANAYRRVGNLRARMGQVEKAETAYRRAAAMLEKLVAVFPDALLYRYELAETYSRADVRAFDYRTSSIDPAALTDALKRLEQAIELIEPLHVGLPGQAEYAALYGRVLTRRGLVLQRLDRADEGEAAFRKALAVRLELATAKPELPWYVYESAVAKRLLADCLYQQHEKSAGAEGTDGQSDNAQVARRSQTLKLTEARTLLDTSITELQKLSKADSRFIPTNMALASAYHSLSAVLVRMGEKSLADEAHRKADAIGRIPGAVPSGANRNSSSRPSRPPPGP